jgi:DNA-binding CsgD family transcriptional regulator
MEKLPTGLTPTDQNIEIFANPHEFGKCFWISEGKTHLFWELPLHIIDDLRDELSSDCKALKGLRLMGLSSEGVMLEQYNYCNRGKLDGIPDISTSGKKTKEYFDCGLKGRCQGEGKVCSPLFINGSRITFRELECLKLIGTGLSYKQIKVEMGFTRETAVNSLTDRIRDKFQCSNNTEVALKVKELGLV